MKRQLELWPFMVLGAAAAGGAVLALATMPTSRQPEPPARADGLPSDYTVLDVEAAARMLASENPRGSERLHVEQIWTQIRSRKRGESLYLRITAGSGWGPQGAKEPPGRARPVATDSPATNRFRTLAEEVLRGERPSTLPGARKFFEPEQQDKAFAIAERARRKLAAGESLTAQERRLLGYKMDASHKRQDWLKTSRFVGAIDGVEFFS